MQQLSPPMSRLPPGAAKWATVEDVAIFTKKEVRTIKRWCERGLFFVFELAAGFGGRWVAVDADSWPLTNPSGAQVYRERRSASSRASGLKGVAARKAKIRTKQPSRRLP